MTTNVFDGNAGLLATDSRWSISSGRYVAYIDDSNFDKLVIYGNAAFMFAGKGVVIQLWKDWIATKPNSLVARPAVDGIAVCIVELPTKAILFAERQDITHEGAHFAGTGAIPAVTCWDKNRDAKKSVESAKLVDVFTGGEVKFVVAADGANNLGAQIAGQVGLVHIDKVTQAIQERGIVMDRKTGLGGLPSAPFKLADLAAAAANDAELADFKAKIASGELAPEAPCNGMYDQWTPEEEVKLNDALTRVFGIK